MVKTRGLEGIAVKIGYASAGGNGGLGGGDGLGRADVHPDAFEPQPEQPPGRAGAVEQPRQRKFAGGRIREQRRRKDRRAGIDERHDLVFRAPPQPAVGQHGEVAAPGIADAARRRRQQQQHIHRGGIEGVAKPREIRLHAVDPHGVGIDVEERRVAEQRQGLGHAAAGAEQRPALVRDDDARTLPRGEMAFDLVGKMMHVDHRAFDAGVGETVEHVVDQAFAADLHQRLRDMPVVGPHAGAEAGRQHHRAFRHHRVWPVGHRIGFGGGTLTPYQPCSGASVGCASERSR